VAALAAAAALGFGLDLITWQLQWPSSARGWDSVLQAFIWFTWPAWPLVLWGLWRWHRHWRSRHLAVPLALAGITLFSAVFTLAIERSLLIALPALAALAAFALPTLNRSLSALIDWFTLLFFSTCALAIWVIWVATQTGVPAKPAANVAKLAPLFEPQFSWLAFIAALLATLAWGWLVVWRTGRHRSALWKSLALPAGGTTLCWVLLMTLWLPMLDHARSFGVVISQVREAIGDSPCLQAHKLSRAEVAALTHQGGLRLEPASAQANCPWLLLDIEEQASLAESVDPAQWTVQRRVGWRANRREDLLLMRRIAP
jgi:4-amino-4-deoxy-L-arabinose transferase-like glycosyltransferase